MLVSVVIVVLWSVTRIFPHIISNSSNFNLLIVACLCINAHTCTHVLRQMYIHMKNCVLTYFSFLSACRHFLLCKYLLLTILDYFSFVIPPFSLNIFIFLFLCRGNLTAGYPLTWKRSFLRYTIMRKLGESSFGEMASLNLLPWLLEWSPIMFVLMRYVRQC